MKTKPLPVLGRHVACDGIVRGNMVCEKCAAVVHPDMVRPAVTYLSWTLFVRGE